MKKIIVISALFFLVSVPAFADTVNIDLSAKTKTGLTLYGVTTGTADNTSPSIGKTSTGVGLGVITNTGGYALTTQHMNGSRGFASSYDSTSIYTKDATVGTAALTSLTATDTSNFSDWTAL